MPEQPCAMANTTADTHSSLFLNLAPEIRLAIYGHVFNASELEVESWPEITTLEPTGLLQCSTLVRREANPEFNKFLDMLLPDLDAREAHILTEHAAATAEADALMNEQLGSLHHLYAAAMKTSVGNGTADRMQRVEHARNSVLFLKSRCARRDARSDG